MTLARAHSNSVKLAGMFLFALTLFAVPSRGLTQSTVLSLGTVSAPPDGDVIVPLLMEPESEQIEVGRITAAVSFNSSLVAFQRGEAGFLLDGVNATFSVQPQIDEADPTRSRLELEVVTEPEDGKRLALRKGLILSLLFRISKETPPDTRVPLKFETVAARDIADHEGPIDPLTAEDGMIEVLSADEMPYVGCFFFTH